MIADNMGILRAKAAALAGMIREKKADCAVETVEETSQIGGGSMPGQALPTVAVALRPNHIPVMELESRLRLGGTPIIARICRDRLLLDVRTLEESEFPVIAACVAQCAGGSADG
jgi:L-seryl-tRNA(Ser) seleniumtransferase